MHPSHLCQRSSPRVATAVMVIIAVAAFATVNSSPLYAQNNSLFQMQDRLGRPIPLTMGQTNLIHTEVPEARSIQKHDIIQVRVDELARMSSDGRAERRKDASLNAILRDWVRLNGLRKLEKDQQSTGDPQVQGTLQEIYRAEGAVESTERLTLSIGSRIVDIRPNGNLVIEGHKEVRINNEVWKVSLTGICRQQDVGRDNTITSDRVIDLRLAKAEEGPARDGYRRGWFKKAYDRWAPF